MADNVYEGMFILDANRYSRDSEAVSGQIPKMIETVGGEIMVSRMWEERRLAYPIDGHRKGTYWLTYFRAKGKDIATLERECQLSDTIIRALFLKVDPRIVDALVAHAQDGPSKPRDETDDKKKDGDKKKRDVDKKKSDSDKKNDAAVVESVTKDASEKVAEKTA